MKTIAFIPVRGGSKGIPGKNIKLMAGKPLVLWTVEAASACAEIDEVIVSTDSVEIRRVVEVAGLPKVRVADRGAATATDTASTESVMLEYAQANEFARMILIQATSPLLQAEDLRGGIRLLQESGADSLVSVVEQKRFIWKREAGGLASPRNYDPAARPRRQNFEGYLVENGAFYICSRKGLLETGVRLHGKMAAYPMDEASYFEIDEPSDWIIVEGLLNKRGRPAGNQQPATSFAESARRIKLLLTDVDGVLTDAGMYYSENGDELKKFNTRDGKGFELLRNAGIKTGIITSENTRLVERRAKKLKLDFLIQGAVEKMPALRQILAQTGFTADEVAYLGDDLADLPVLRAVGLSACPADAMADIQAAVMHRCQAAGGGGVVRELVELILNARESPPVSV